MSDHRRRVLLAAYVMAMLVAVVLSYQQGQRSEGEKGVRGEQGGIGEQGVVGEKGVRGEQGGTGDTGDTGEKGVRGEQGISGIICPEGFARQEVRVVTVHGVRAVFACVRE